MFTRTKTIHSPHGSAREGHTHPRGPQASHASEDAHSKMEEQHCSTTQRVVDRPPLTIIDYSLGGAGSWGCMSAIHVARVHFNWSSPTTLRYPSIPFGLSYHPTTDPKTQRGSPSALKTAGLSVTGCNQYRCTAPSNMAASYVHWLDIPQT